MPGEIDSYQAQIEGLKKSAKSPDKLKTALGSGVLTGAVDEGQALLKKVAGELKSAEAKAYLKTARNQLVADLSYIAGQGQSILAASAKNKKPGKKKGGMKMGGETVPKTGESVEANVDGINNTIAILQTKLTEQKTKIGEYKKYEENEKKANDYIKSVKEGRKLYDEYNKKDIQNMELRKEGKEPIPLDDLRMQIIAAGKKMETDSKITDALKSSDPEINAMYDELKGKIIQETDATWLLRKSDIEGLEKELGSQDAYQKIDALKEVSLKLEIEMAKYIALADSINANWEKADEAQKKEVTSLEQSLLQGYAVARGIIGEVQADVDKGKINWPDGITKLGEKISGHITKIENNKIQRIVNKRLKDNKYKDKDGKETTYDKYYQFGENEKGNMTYGGTDKLKSDKWIDIWDEKKDKGPERNAIIISCKGFLMDARAQVRAETKQAEVKGLSSQGQKGMDRLKKKLGDKGSKYFEALNKMSAGDREGAMKLLGEYGAQGFSKKDLETHAGVMKEAQTMYETMDYSKSYYSALSSLKSGNQKQAVGMFKGYIAEVGKLPKEQQALHATQLSAARESIQSIGMDSVEKMENLFGDVRKLREAKRKLAGAHLHYSESMEDEYMTAELAVLRKKVAKGDADIDVFKEIEAAKQRVKAKVQKKLDDPKVKGKYEPSLLDEAGDLFKAMHDKHPSVRKKALIEFAKKCREERAYGMAKRYLDHAMEENYKWYSKKIDKDKIRQHMMKDPKIVKWVTTNARAQYLRMKAKGTDMGLTFDQVRNQLMNRKLSQAYKAEMRKAMTLDGHAGEDYQESAKKDGATWGDFHIVTGNSEWVTHRAGGADEALILYNEYFKEGEKDKVLDFEYNPTQWGAEDWDEFEDDSIKFAFETACTMGIGTVSASVGRKAGSMVLRRLATKGLSRAAIQTIKEGGKTALKAAVKKQRKGILKAYLAYHAAGIAAEGATMFALGTFQSGITDPKGTAEQFNSAWSGPSALGEAMAKAAIYRMMGGVGQSLIGKNPSLIARVGEHFVSGVAGEGVEYGALVLKGQAENYTMRDFIKGMVQDSFQAAGRGFTSGRFSKTMSKNEIAARKALTQHEMEQIGVRKPEDIGSVAVKKITQEGEEFTLYQIQTNKGIKTMTAQELAMLSPGMRDKVTSLSEASVAKTQKKLSAFSESAGVDLTNPKAIHKARITPDGRVIINGKTAKGINVDSIGFLPQATRNRIYELAPNSALDTHFRSRFGTNDSVPAHLKKGGETVEGWIDAKGLIHYNLDFINSGNLRVDASEGGQYRSQDGPPIMPEGFSVRANSKGNLVIVSPGGNIISYKDWLQSPHGKRLGEALKQIKNHETTHRALEHGYSTDMRGTDGKHHRAIDYEKTLDLMGHFAKPGTDGSVPEGKIPLKKMDWKNIQEFLCRVSDGSIKLSESQRKALETTIKKEIPGFAFKKVRNIDTRKLAKNPSAAFKRSEAAARSELKPEVLRKKAPLETGNKLDLPGHAFNKKFIHYIWPDGRVRLSDVDPRSPEAKINPGKIMDVPLKAILDAQNLRSAAEKVARKSDVLTLGDIHGDAKNFAKTLEHAGYAKMDATGRLILTEAGKKTTLVQTGDIFDRGPDVLKVLDMIKDLRAQGADIKISIGNHELMSFEAITCGSVMRGDPGFYQELNKLIGLAQQHPDINPLLLAKSSNSDVSKFLMWYFQGGQEIFSSIGTKYFPPGTNPDLPSLIRKSHEIFFGNGEYASVVGSMKIMHKVDDVLYVHAGIDDKWARIIEQHGIEGANRKLSEAFANHDYSSLNNSGRGEMAKAFWLRGENVTPYTAKVLKQIGIKAIVHGHSVTGSGKQELNHSNGIRIINNDIGMSGHYHGQHGGVTIGKGGEVKGFSEKTGDKPQEMGVLPSQKTLNVGDPVPILSSNGRKIYADRKIHSINPDTGEVIVIGPPVGGEYPQHKYDSLEALRAEVAMTDKLQNLPKKITVRSGSSNKVYENWKFVSMDPVSGEVFISPPDGKAIKRFDSIDHLLVEINETKNILPEFKSHEYSTNNRIGGEIPDGFVDVSRSGRRETVKVDRANDPILKAYLAQADSIGKKAGAPALGKGMSDADIDFHLKQSPYYQNNFLSYHYKEALKNVKKLGSSGFVAKNSDDYNLLKKTTFKDWIETPMPGGEIVIFKPPEVKKLSDPAKIQEVANLLLQATNHPGSLNSASQLQGEVLLGHVVNTKAAAPRHNALLFQLMAQKAGLDCTVVRGQVMHEDGNYYTHSWNEVKMADGRTIIVDTSRLESNGTPHYSDTENPTRQFFDVSGKALYKEPVVAVAPANINKVQIAPDGGIVINGKTDNVYSLADVDALPPSAKSRIFELAPTLAIDTHYRSRFGNNADVPPSLREAGKTVEGWIDTNGVIHYNLDFLNSGHLRTTDPSGGTIEGQKIIPEGFKVNTNLKGDLVIVTPDNQIISYRKWIKTPEGKVLHEAMKQIKNHEATHQTLEMVYTREVERPNGKSFRAEDPAKIKPLLDMFEVPREGWTVPEAKIPIEKSDWPHVQEFLCRVSDGSIKLNEATRRKIESRIQKQIPGFTFKRVRSIATKKLAKNPSAEFKRLAAAAKIEAAKAAKLPANVKRLKARLAKFEGLVKTVKTAKAKAKKKAQAAPVAVEAKVLTGKELKEVQKAAKQPKRPTILDQLSNVQPANLLRTLQLIDKLNKINRNNLIDLSMILEGESQKPMPPGKINKWLEKQIAKKTIEVIGNTITEHSIGKEIETWDNNKKGLIRQKGRFIVEGVLKTTAHLNAEGSNIAAKIKNDFKEGENIIIKLRTKTTNEIRYELVTKPNSVNLDLLNTAWPDSTFYNFIETGELHKRSNYKPENFAPQLLKELRAINKRTDLTPKEKKTERRKKRLKIDKKIDNREYLLAKTINTYLKTIASKLKSDPTYSAEKLLAHIESNAKLREQFSPQEIAHLKTQAEAFLRQSKNIDTYYNNFKDKPAVLFEMQFGFKPQGKVELIKQDFALTFHLHDLADSATLNRGKLDDVASLHGQSFSNSPIPSLEGFVTTVYGKLTAKEIAETNVHEQRHNINRAISNGLRGTPDLEVLKNATTTNEAKKNCQLLLKSLFIKGLERGKDEIIAHLSHGREAKDVDLAIGIGDINRYNYWKTNNGFRDNMKSAVENFGNLLPPNYYEITIEPQIQKYTRQHQQYMAGAIDIASRVGEGRMNELAVRPLMRWNRFTESGGRILPKKHSMSKTNKSTLNDRADAYLKERKKDPLYQPEETYKFMKKNVKEAIEKNGMEFRSNKKIPEWVTDKKAYVQNRAAAIQREANAAGYAVEVGWYERPFGLIIYIKPILKK